jgi:hypothetical protein
VTLMEEEEGGGGGEEQLVTPEMEKKLAAEGETPFRPTLSERH